MNRLREKRLEANLRLVDLSRLARVSQSVIWYAEMGLDDRLRKETRSKIIFGLNAGGLQVREEDIFPPQD